MPSARETLMKILKLERQQGYKDNAVIGGLAAYSQNWSRDAHKQARRPEHHILVEELEELLKQYKQVAGTNQRHEAISYMMDRLMGRVPPPNRYRERLQHYQDKAPKTEESTGHEPAAPPPRQETGEPTNDNEDSPQHAGSGTPGDDEQLSNEKKRKSRSRRKRGKDKQARNEPENEQAPPPRQQKRQQSKQPYLNPSKRTEVTRDPDEEFAYEFDTSYNYVEAVSEEEGQIPFNSTGRRPRPDLPEQPRLERPPREPRPVIDPQEAADLLRGLNAPVTEVKGVGPRMAQSLNALGIETIDDLLFYLPRKYDDYTSLTPIVKLPPNETVTVIGTVTHTEVRMGRNSRKDFYMEVDDGSGKLSVMFFGQEFLVRSIRRGKQVVLSGKTSVYRDRLQMSSPQWEGLDGENLHTVGIVPVYPLTQGLTARALRRLMKKAVNYWSRQLPDYVPESVLDRTEMGDLGWTLQNLHFPEGWDHHHHATRRYVFDQLLTLQLAILSNRRDWQSVPAPALDITDEFVETFIETVFPYPLTGAQRRAVDDIRRDISRDTPMNRLLQGDVGSGKTAVAVAAMAMTFNAGKQSALMAPTGILAEQHYRNISQTLEAMPGDHRPVVGLLTSALTGTEREAIYNGLADGSIDIIIGTHAVIQEGVEFHDLGLAIVDEQHRFGVEQRGQLRGKGTNPHLLVMTATPIPRTLALTLYADLDLSVMDEMPPGRTPVKTRVVLPTTRERIYSFIEAQIKEGRQAFIVYPLVEASDKIDAGSAVEAFEHLSQVFFRYRVGLLHGKMKPTEKDEIMASFSNHEFDVMVTTSVAEVGVDIPNASVIVIDGANRFGLAQLHQFRGRVGRGKHVSYCFLVPDDVTPETEERLDKITLEDIDNREYPESERRLKALELSTDGFKLAEIDWKLRGPGDLVGTRQSGKPLLKMAEYITPDLVTLAQREARTVYEEDPYLEQAEHQLLKERVVMLFDERSDLS